MRALREEFVKRGIYSQTIEGADVVLINSFHFGDIGLARRLFEAKRENPRLKVAHRIDGPFTLVRGFWDVSDDGVNRLNKLFADGTIFQTSWSKAQCLKRGLASPVLSAQILNSPLPKFFFDDGAVRPGGKKIRLIASSWSANNNKGADVYEWLDLNLNWDLYEMDFYGNSPVRFKNIRKHDPVSSRILGDRLRKSDVFISAARNEPCSNALIEALHCGLPAIGFRGGGTPEILDRAGELFSSAEEIPIALGRVVKDYDHYRNTISLPSLSDTADRYLDFFDSVAQLPRPKMVSRLDIRRFEIEFESLWFRIRKHAAENLNLGALRQPNR